jgi:hypothetical protein
MGALLQAEATPGWSQQVLTRSQLNFAKSVAEAQADLNLSDLKHLPKTLVLALVHWCVHSMQREWSPWTPCQLCLE